jgi:glutamate/tyrosine decarboxylase-like PLP-dependent enzyme
VRRVRPSFGAMVNRNSPFAAPLRTVLEHALSHLEDLAARPVGATTDLQSLRSRLSGRLADEGVPAEAVIHALARDASGGILGSAGGRFFAWVIGGSLPAALAADWLASAWDQNAALHACSPAAAVVEEVVEGWLKDLLGLPAQSSFALVSGCQLAHITCLAAARHALLARRGWNVEDRGLSGAPTIRLLSSGSHHGSLDRAVRLLGLGRDQLIALPGDAAGQLQPHILQQAIEADPRSPTIVLLQAGDINTGAYDRFESLIPIAKERGAWVHVDGAFGLWAAASKTYRHLLQGVDGADSWATDGHKWLNVPYDAGYAFVADTDAHRATVSHRAQYLTHHADARDQIDWNPDWSRRARGFATYAALRQLGRNGAAAMVERCCAHARSLVTGLGALPGTEILSAPIVNQGLVRFRDPSSSAVADHDRWTERVIAGIVDSGEAFLGATTWRGQRAMRISVCNWQTSDNDVERTIAAASAVLRTLHQRHAADA